LCRHVDDGNGPCPADGIGISQAEHHGEVAVGVVVGQDGGYLPGATVKVTASHAQVVGGCRRCVIDVERVGEMVCVRVHAVRGPGGRYELHRSDRAVVDDVAVESTSVGIADHLGAVSVERNSDDPRHGETAG
jgi:hypothetical protein